MKVTAAQIAQLIGAEIEGDPDASVSRPERIEQARPGDLAFLDNARYERYAYETGASILLVSRDFVPAQPVRSTLLRVANVREALAVLMEIFAGMGNGSERGSETWVSPRAAVSESAEIGVGAVIGDFAVVEAGARIGAGAVIGAQVFIGGRAQIGAQTIVHPGAKIMADTEIGERCIIHPNAVLGGDGFGYAPQSDGSWKKMPHVGRVVLEDDVEIGACACIDRAAIGVTRIGAGAKIDNLVHIAHNVEIGPRTAIAAQAGVAGSSKLGAGVQLGGQVGIAGHLQIADGVRIQAQSGVASHVKEAGKALFGAPAIDYADYVRAYVVFKNLPELQRKVRELEKILKAEDRT